MLDDELATIRGSLNTAASASPSRVTAAGVRNPAGLDCWVVISDAAGGRLCDEIP